MRIVISADSNQIAEMAARLDPKRAMMALSVAVNTTARQTKNQARKTIARESSIRAGTVERGLSINPYSSPGTLSATVIGSGRPISLKEFRARQGRKGVSATVWGRRQLYPGSFIVESLGGHVFHRLTDKRFPIEKMWGAGIAQVMAQDHVSAVIVNHGETRLLVNAQRQLDRYIAGAGGAGR